MLQRQRRLSPDKQGNSIYLGTQEWAGVIACVTVIYSHYSYICTCTCTCTVVYGENYTCTCVCVFIWGQCTDESNHIGSPAYMPVWTTCTVSHPTITACITVWGLRNVVRVSGSGWPTTCAGTMGGPCVPLAGAWVTVCVVSVCPHALHSSGYQWPGLNTVYMYLYMNNVHGSSVGRASAWYLPPELWPPGDSQPSQFSISLRMCRQNSARDQPVTPVHVNSLKETG